MRTASLIKVVFYSSWWSEKHSELTFPKLLQWNSNAPYDLEPDKTAITLHKATQIFCYHVYTACSIWGCLFKACFAAFASVLHSHSTYPLGTFWLQKSEISLDSVAFSQDCLLYKLFPKLVVSCIMWWVITFSHDRGCHMTSHMTRGMCTWGCLQMLMWWMAFFNWERGTMEWLAKTIYTACVFLF